MYNIREYLLQYSKNKSSPFILIYAIIRYICSITFQSKSFVPRFEDIAGNFTKRGMESNWLSRRERDETINSSKRAREKERAWEGEKKEEENRSPSANARGSSSSGNHYFVRLCAFPRRFPFLRQFPVLSPRPRATRSSSSKASKLLHLPLF